jgi:hypothetical protein
MKCTESLEDVPHPGIVNNKTSTCHCSMPWDSAPFHLWCNHLPYPSGCSGSIVVYLLRFEKKNQGTELQCHSRELNPGCWRGALYVHGPMPCPCPSTTLYNHVCPKPTDEDHHHFSSSSPSSSSSSSTWGSFCRDLKSRGCVGRMGTIKRDIV